jgi:hypothetical protein
MVIRISVCPCEFQSHTGDARIVKEHRVRALGVQTRKASLQVNDGNRRFVMRQIGVYGPETSGIVSSAAPSSVRLLRCANNNSLSMLQYTRKYDTTLPRFGTVMFF